MPLSFFRSVFKRCISVHQYNILPYCYYQPLRFRSESIEGYKLKEEFSKVDSLRYSQMKQAQFYQEQPKLDNPFLADIPLQSFLNHYVPDEVKREISDDLQRFGDRIVDEIDDLGWECELNLPSLENIDVWGRRTDELRTCHAWKKQHDISSEEGIVAIPYEQKLHLWSRLYQICKIYLYSPSAGLYTCPLAMTDGAAKTILSWKKSVSGETNERFVNAFNKLISRDPETFWTSGQWMTERRGGSDVANSTETVAVPDNGFYRLYGYKWFSSATDSNMALTLARIVQDNEVSEDLQTLKGLTMFYVETRNPQGELNNMEIVKLKNKLGTRSLPTAELLLDGCVAYKLFDESRGIASISHMLNITRLHNAVASVGAMRRILQLSRDYSRKRIAFGKTLAEIPLHMRVLSAMEMEIRGSLLLLLKVGILLGKTEVGVSTTDELLLLRLMSPILKLYTAKQAVAVASEGLETFGGQGYMEDSRLPVLLRNAQVLPIWEGTTNVMSLDVIRSLLKTDSEALMSLRKSIELCLEAGKKESTLQDSCSKIDKSINHILHFIKTKPESLNIAARDISYSIARTYIGASLIENAAITKKMTDIFMANQWCEVQELCPLSLHKDYTYYVKNDYEAIMEGCVVD